jgi:putative flavoprotein involved in K+ transport
MTNMHDVETIVIGGGQAGLAAGYHLRREGRPFLILDANDRVGDSWRKRWDSLRLFSPARFNALDGMPFPAPGFSFVTKDQMADYLEAYAAEFNLPVKSGARVKRVSRQGERFRIETTGADVFEADNVVVAMANYQRPSVPAFAAELSPEIRQLHSMHYANPSQLRPGPVLVVGLGNSGAEIALEVSGTHQTYVSGRDPGSIPFRIDGLASRLFLSQVVFRGVFHRLLTVDTPVGRRARGHGDRPTTPLIRVRPGHLEAAGVQRLGRTVGVREGLPLLDDGRTLEVSNVIWCTGFQASFEWLDLPVHGVHGPLQERGICTVEPGLYFVGLHFQYAQSSSMVQGVSRDAARVVRAIVARARTTATAQARNSTTPDARQVTLGGQHVAAR